MKHDVDPREWAKWWTISVGQAVRRHRDRQGITAEQLAARTTSLGYPLSRNAITALETGRKDFVTVQDLTVLAIALRVVPALLLYPVDLSLAPLPLLPGGPLVDPMDAIEWTVGETLDAGEAAYASEGIDNWTRNNNVLYWMRGHEEGVQLWLTATAHLVDGAGEMTEYYALLRADAELQVRANREQLETAGQPLPPLPPDLNVTEAYVDPFGRVNIARTYFSGRRAPRAGRK